MRAPHPRSSPQRTGGWQRLLAIVSAAGCCCCCGPLLMMAVGGMFTTLGTAGVTPLQAGMRRRRRAGKNETTSLNDWRRRQMNWTTWFSACNATYNCEQWHKHVEFTMRLHASFSTSAVVEYPYDKYEPVWNCRTRERFPAKAGDGPKFVCGIHLYNKS